MKKRGLLWQVLVLALVVFTAAGCSQSVQGNQPNDVPDDENLFELVRKAADEYLSSSRVKSMNPEQLYEEYVEGRDGKYILVDIRNSGDFESKNIRGSINIPYAQTADLEKLSNLPKDKTIVLIDYNGHWAAQTAATWNMLGYDAVPLLYGIQSWTNEQEPAGYEVFPSKALDYPLVETTYSFEEYNLPEMNYGKGTIEELIESVSSAYLNRYYTGIITAEDLMAAIEDGSASSQYFLVDVRKSEHYKLGHVEGSVNIPLAELAKEKNLRHLPDDKKIILIGYDGMDASQGVRVLVTMGYDAVALKYGMSYWNGDEKITGVSPVRNLVKDYYELTPLNYIKPSTGPATCG